MDNRINFAMVIGVILVLAFAVTLTQTGKQAISQDSDIITDELITHWLEKYDPSEQTISVTGSATASSNTDTLIMILGVESEAKTANESLSKNSNALNSVISALTNSGISKDDIQTSNFRIYPLNDFSAHKYYLFCNRSNFAVRLYAKFLLVIFLLPNPSHNESLLFL